MHNYIILESAASFSFKAFAQFFLFFLGGGGGGGGDERGTQQLVIY